MLYVTFNVHQYGNRCAEVEKTFRDLDDLKRFAFSKVTSKSYITAIYRTKSRYSNNECYFEFTENAGGYSYKDWTLMRIENEDGILYNKEGRDGVPYHHSKAVWDWIVQLRDELKPKQKTFID